MDPWVWIAGIAAIVGIVTGIVQLIDYLQKQREKKQKPKPEPTVASPSATPPTPPVPLPRPLIPNNLPPRSTFVGREKEKASLYEALASTETVICIEGIGGIGKTSLALEVAHEILKASERAAVPSPPKTPPKNTYEIYQGALDRFLGQLDRNHPRYADALLYQQRLHENLTHAERYGDDANCRAERPQIVEQLNKLALATLGISFNEICRQVETGEGQRADEKKDGIRFEGMVWTSAKDRELALGDILDTIARTLGYPNIVQQPAGEKHETVNQLLRSKPYLIIVDNLETVTDPGVPALLLKLPEPSRALATSREQWLGQGWAVPLKQMDQAEALALVRSEGRRLGLVSLEKADEQQLLRLCTTAGAAPLAIKWAIGQIKQKGQSLENVLTALQGARGELFEKIFSRSWSLLDESTRHILMAMPIFATTATKAAIEAVSDAHNPLLDDGVGQLVEMSLLEVTGEPLEPRYTIHPLTKAYVGQKLQEDGTWKAQAHERAAQYFLAFSQRYGDDALGFPELEKELANISGVINERYARGDWHRVIDFTRFLSNFLRDYSYWRERLDYTEKMQHAAQELGDSSALAFALMESAWTLYFQERFEEAETKARKAGELYNLIGDAQGSADICLLLGRIASMLQQFDLASNLLNEALQLYQQSQDTERIVAARAALVTLAYDQKDYDAVQRQTDDLLPIVQDPYIRGKLTGFRGSAALKQGRYEEAKKYLEEALRMHYITGRQIGVGHEKRWLALLEEAQGNTEAALNLAQESLAIFERWGSRPHMDDVQKIVERLRKSAGRHQ